MKPVTVSSELGRLALVAWLEKNDQDWLQVMKDTAAIFGPLEDVSYLNYDPEKQREVWAWMRKETERVKEAMK